MSQSYLFFPNQFVFGIEALRSPTSGYDSTKFQFHFGTISTDSLHDDDLWTYLQLNK